VGVGQELKRILKSKGLTIKQLSEISGVSVNTLYSITKRDSNEVSYKTLESIARALGEKPEALLPAEYREALKDDVESFIELSSGKLTRNNLLPHLIEDVLYEIDADEEDIAFEDSDAFLVEKLKKLSDGKLKKRILESFEVLNRRGKIEAMIRIDELTENSRFQK